MEAFELEAFDYILKPYNEPRIINLLQKLEHAGKSQPGQGEVSIPHNRTVNLVKGERIIVTPCEQIYYAEADEKLTHVYTRTDRYVMTMALSEFVSRLPAEGFFRCHRSYCVNINKIREIVPWFNSTYLIRLHDLPFEVPVSRSNIKAFRQLMRL
ncbi:Transcriptional regulatory protein YpdB [compost metagenome]